MKPILLLLILASFALAQSSDTKFTSDNQHDAMNKRGNIAMGFDQQKTTHHFKLAKNGGSINVFVKNAEDKESVRQIRDHLQHIAGEFKKGNFALPGFIHAQTPPGVPEMQKLKGDITYTYAQTANGAEVRIESKNKEAIAAIQQFLKFQITDHRTGDKEEMEHKH